MPHMAPSAPFDGAPFHAGGQDARNGLPAAHRAEIAREKKPRDTPATPLNGDTDAGTHRGGGISAYVEVKLMLVALWLARR